MDGAGRQHRQHYLARHGRLDALVHQLDINKRPCNATQHDSARVLGVLDERLASRD